MPGLPPAGGGRSGRPAMSHAEGRHAQGGSDVRRRGYRPGPRAPGCTPAPQHTMTSPHTHPAASGPRCGRRGPGRRGPGRRGPGRPAAPGRLPRPAGPGRARPQRSRRPRPPVSCPSASAGALKLIFPVMMRHPAPGRACRAASRRPGRAGRPEPGGQLARAPPHGPRRPHPALPYQDQPGLRGVSWSPGVF
jgi:hypothetical protein